MSARTLGLLACGWLVCMACGGTAPHGTTTTTGGSSGTTGGCSSRCSQGNTECVGTQIQSCTLGANGCWTWTAPAACPSGYACSVATKSCAAVPTTTTSGGTTGASCTNPCPVAQSTRCVGGQLETCGTVGSCLEWSAPVACPTNETCSPSASACVGAGSGTGTGTTGTGCTAGCPSAGATECMGVQVLICHSVNGCLQWSSPQSCPSGQSCGGNPATCESMGTGTTGTTGTAGGSTTTGGTCTDQCQAGGTQCVGAQVEGCDVGTDGCLEWQAPGDCGSGQACDSVVNNCVDACSVSQTQADCGSAASAIGSCCAGAFSITGDELCQAEVNAGNDPDSQCQALAGQSCATLTSEYFNVGQCCCPAGEYCDEDISSWPCVQSCVADSNCTQNPNRPSCAPNDNAGALIISPYVCKPDDATAYDGCSGASETCSSAFDCWSFDSSEVCTTSCNQNSDCGNPGVVCCDLNASCSNDIESCSGFGACLPCGTY